MRTADFDREPTDAELAAIEAEQPLIDAELAWLDAEVALLAADERGGVTALDWRRLRRAEARVIREALLLAGRQITVTDPPRAA